MTKVNDPIDEWLDQDTARDHAAAYTRGRRILALADACLDRLVVAGLLEPGRVPEARVAIFHVLADDIYGLAAIDIPPLRD